LGTEEKMKRQPVESIALSLKIIVWIVAVPAILITILLSLEIWSEASYLVDDTTCVVVAKTDLTVGIMLSTNNLARHRFDDSKLETDDYVCYGDASVLFGHKLIADIKRGEPIEWHSTDIVITNQVNSQQSSGTDK